MKDKNFRFYWEEPHGKKEPNINIGVPGFKRDEITVNLTSNSITINASKKVRKSEKGKNFYTEEAFASSFSRSMSLPHKINAEDFDVVVSDNSVMLKRKKKKQLVR